jgi:putative ABC transport system permease protein
VAGLGLVLMLVGLVGGLGTTGALSLLGAGALAVFVGAGMLSPLAVGPVAAVVGRPLQAVGGVAGSIARANATRFPGRTAGTAAALMVGVALVAFASIFVNGFKASFSGAFESWRRADIRGAGIGRCRTGLGEMVAVHGPDWADPPGGR